MKVNIVLRIEDSADQERAYEARFGDCDTNVLLGKDAKIPMKPLIESFFKYLGEDTPPPRGGGREG